MSSRLVLGFAALLLPICTIWALPADHDASMVKQTSGKVLFMNYCASCHGEDAKGAGPAAIALKTQPPDLTALAKRNHGKFSVDDVRKAITGEGTVPAHGTRDMPTWGPMFLAMNGVNQKDADQRIANLTDYLKTIQGK